MKNYKKNYIIGNSINNLLIAYEMIVIVSFVIILLDITTYAWIIVGAVCLWPLFDIISGIIKNKKDDRVDVKVDGNTLTHEGITFDLLKVNNIEYNPGIYDKHNVVNKRPAELIIKDNEGNKHIIENPSLGLIKHLKNKCINAKYKLIPFKSLLIVLVGPWVIVLIVFIISIFKNK